MPHLGQLRTGDEDQRFEVLYTMDGKQKVFGWSERYPEGFVQSILLHPSMTDPVVIDRKPEKYCACCGGRSQLVHYYCYDCRKAQDRQGTKPHLVKIAEQNQ